MTSKSIVLGVEGLSKLIGSVESPYVLLVTGNPGAGKTTLASTICYKNSLVGNRCLYVTFYEHKEKLFKYMSNLGLDLAAAESRGLLRFVRLAIPSSIETFAESLTSMLSEEKYDVVVIDSVNPLLEVAESQTSRAWFANFFYNIAQAVQGLLVLVSEISQGSERAESGIPEFVTDAIVVLKQRIEDKFLVRSIEVRKARGSNIFLAEVPFSISAEGGIKVWIPPVLSEVAPEGEAVDLACDVFKKALGELRRGQVINIVYPSDCRHPAIVIPIFLVVAANRLKTLVVSYKYQPKVIEDMVVSWFGAYGVSESEVVEVFRRYIKVVSINPFSYSTSQLAIREMEIINAENPDLVVFHGPEVARVATDMRTYHKELFNEINYLKNRGVLVVRLVSYVDEVIYRAESSMADAIVRLDCDTAPSGLTYSIYFWRKGREPYVTSLDELKECIIGEAPLILRSFSKTISAAS